MMQDVVAVIDPGDRAHLRVLERAGQMVRGGRLKVLTIVPAPLQWVSDHRPLEVQAAKEIAGVESKIADALATAGIHDADVHVYVSRRANIGDDIVERVRKLGSELLVIGTHGRTGLDALLIGSVAERVVRHATCDVLVVRVR